MQPAVDVDIVECSTCWRHGGWRPVNSSTPIQQMLALPPMTSAWSIQHEHGGKLGSHQGLQIVWQEAKKGSFACVGQSAATERSRWDTHNKACHKATATAATHPYTGHFHRVFADEKRRIQIMTLGDSIAYQVFAALYGAVHKNPHPGELRFCRCARRRCQGWRPIQYASRASECERHAVAATQHQMGRFSASQSRSSKCSDALQPCASLQLEQRR